MPDLQNHHQTNHSDTERKLAAILFADIVGYTALMQKGEAMAMAILNRFQEVTKAVVANHSGEIIKTYGDGCLILFSSTVNAVKCALEMQLAHYYLQKSEEFEKALPLLLKAIEINPKDRQDTRKIYGDLTYIFYLTDQLEIAEKLRRKVVELYPNDPGANYSMGFALRIQGKHQKANQFFKKCYELHPDGFTAIDGYAFNQILLGNFQEALKHYEILRNKIDQGFKEANTTYAFRHRMAYALWHLDRKEEAQQLLKEHIQRLLSITKNGSHAFDLAGAYAFLEEKEKAYDWLEKMPFWYVSYHLLRVDPFFDSIRNEPRFKQIVHKQDQEVARMRSKLEQHQTLEGELLFSIIN